jgi:hypothetical protein
MGKMDDTDTGWCPVVGFVISHVEPSDSMMRGLRFSRG